MTRFGLATCWLQISCSSQAELHWHDVCMKIADLKCSQNHMIVSNHFNNHKIWKISMKIKYIKPQKLKVLIALFFGTAGLGIFMGLVIAEGIQSLYITLLGVINLCLGGLVAYLLLTQKPKVRDSRKYKGGSKWNS